jgi:LuxR family maltose regulon positive regulatory protein
MAGLALVYQARGENAEAWRVVEILSDFQVEQRGHEEDELHSLSAGLMLEQGNTEGAFRWADAFTTPPPDAPLLWVEVTHITRARILLARNTADDVRLALQILDGLLDIAERTHNTRCKIPILALRALALDAQGHADQALVALQEAVDLSRPGGFLRAFVDLGPRMKGLLGRLAEPSSEAEPVRRILAAFPVPGPGRGTGDTQAPPQHRDSSAPRIAEPLTARELQILTLLREPVWPKEIACQLGISPLTVKRHLINVYRKLGVTTRWDAVSRAIELGILPPR